MKLNARKKTKKSPYLSIVSVLVFDNLAYETNLEHVKILAVRDISESRIRIDLASAVNGIDALERIDNALDVSPSPNKLFIFV